MRRLRIKVGGMHCKGCAATIAGSLKRQLGVTDAKVNFTTGEGTLLYDQTKTNSDAILNNLVFREPSPFAAEIIEDAEVQ